MTGSLSLPFSFLCVKDLVDTYVLAYAQKRAESWSMMSRPAESQKGREYSSRCSGADKNRAAASRMGQVRYRCIKAREINQRPTLSPKEGVLMQMAGESKIEHQRKVEHNQGRVETSEEGPEQWLIASLLLPPLACIFQRAVQGQCRHTGNTWAGCPHALVSSPIRIPQNSSNLGHYSFNKMFREDSSNGQSIQSYKVTTMHTFPRAPRHIDCHESTDT